MEARARSGAGRDLPFTFFVSEASVGRRGRRVLMRFQRPFLVRKGDGCVKDTCNPPRYRLRHPGGLRPAGARTRRRKYECDNTATGYVSRDKRSPAPIRTMRFTYI